VFAGLKPAVLTRLIEVRGSLDHGFARLDAAAARELFEAVLDHQTTFLATGDTALLRGFLRSFRAMRAAEGLGAENLLHAMIAIGDVTAQVVNKELPAGPRTHELVSSLVRTSWTTARLVVEIIAEELAARTAQLGELGAGS